MSSEIAEAPKVGRGFPFEQFIGQERLKLLALPVKRGKALLRIWGVYRMFLSKAANNAAKRQKYCRRQILPHAFNLMINNNIIIIFWLGFCARLGGAGRFVD